ncbi:hypothetical protein [Streptomyces sp. NBC_00286]|uniref:hypothetical protein n=1 Tax=Streptomyces sp. NBC_00286 TaxID=2975701 RepID=UPI002E29306F|nr:hypothetical protein [Streptomyces sp. NBC_00286]
MDITGDQFAGQGEACPTSTSLAAAAASPATSTPRASEPAASSATASARYWLRTSAGPQLLSQLADQNGEITYELLYGLPQDAATRYLRMGVVDMDDLAPPPDTSVQRPR